MAGELNSSTLIARRDYGMKIAMPGFDVLYAGDNELLFNSSFPILQIKVLATLQPDSIGSSSASQGGELFATYGTAPYRNFVYRWRHDLGFVPFIIYMDPASRFSNPYGADEQYIYLSVSEGGTIPTGKVLVAPTDITKDIEYPYTALPLPSITGSLADYGFKSTAFGEIEAHDFDNLGIDPRLQSQMVLAIKTLSTSFVNTAINYQYPAGITTNDCMVYGFFKTTISYDSGSPVVWKQMGENGQAIPSYFRNKYTTDSVSANTDSTMPISLVITRAPMVAPIRLDATL
jgi:hypothetical protein